MANSYNTRLTPTIFNFGDYFLRATEDGQTVPIAQWVNGANASGGTNSGLGVASPYPLAEGMGWTLLDQYEVAREPQVSQLIGGTGFVDRSAGDWSTSGGVSGNQPQNANSIQSGVNADNIADPNLPGGYIPDPTGSPNFNAALQMTLVTDLANGWTAVNYP